VTGALSCSDYLACSDSSLTSATCSINGKNCFWDGSCKDLACANIAYDYTQSCPKGCKKSGATACTDAICGDFKTGDECFVSVIDGLCYWDAAATPPGCVKMTKWNSLMMDYKRIFQSIHSDLTVYSDLTSSTVAAIS
jgi:hypothetical protein